MVGLVQRDNVGLRILYDISTLNHSYIVGINALLDFGNLCSLYCNGSAYRQSQFEFDPFVIAQGTTMYDNGEMKVIVTTSEISREEESDPDEKPEAALPESVGPSKKHKIPVKKTKPLKKAAKRKSRPKLQRKRDKRKGIKPAKNKR